MADCSKKLTPTKIMSVVFRRGSVTKWMWGCKWGAVIKAICFSSSLKRKACRQCGPVYQQPLDISLHQVSYIFLITSAKSYQFILCLDQQSSDGPRYGYYRSLSLILAPQQGKEERRGMSEDTEVLSAPAEEDLAFTVWTCNRIS